MSESRTHTIAPGVEIPLLGFGTYLIPNADAAGIVEAALTAGYRHVDTAETYQNEVGVGEGLRRGMASNGLRRTDVFVTTKLWPGSVGGAAFKSTEMVLRSLDESLERLGLDYVDLYLIHAPVSQEQRIMHWKALVELNERGRARAVGVSNFTAAHIEEIVEAGLPMPQANQIELHPWSQKPELVHYLTAHEITPIAYSSLVPLSTWRTAAGHASGKTDAMRADGERGDSPFKTMAVKYGVSEAQVLLRWGVQSGYPVLPKSTSPLRMRENADLFSFHIDDADMALIKTMDRGQSVAWGTFDPMQSS